MTKLISPYPGIIVYKNKHGQIIARTKPGPNKKIKTDPACRLIREHGAAFGKAATAGKMIRRVFYDWEKNIGDGQLNNRLSSLLLKMIKSATHENRMDPQWSNGDLSLLDGFQFNAKASIYSTFLGRWSLSFEHDTWQVGIAIPAFTSTMIHNPNGGFSHFRLIPIIASLNPRSGECILVKGDQGDPGKPVASEVKTHNAISLNMNIDAVEERVVIIALGMEFYRQIGEKQWTPVAAGGHNALGIIKTYRVCAN